MRSLVEWIVALAVFASAIWLVLPTLREWAPLPTGTVTLVESTLPALPGNVPAGAESVPLLMLENGQVIRLGMPEGDVKSHALARLSAGPPMLEPGIIDERLILPFREGRSRFWLVLDKTERGREREVTAIYVR
jgi:hypothetical protein